MQNFRRYAATVAAFAAMLYGAMIIAAFGMISLLMNRDVIPQTSTGPLIVPVMTGVAIVIVFCVFLYIALWVHEDRQRIAIGTALLTGVAAYFFFCLVGAALVGAASKDVFDFIAFLAVQLVSPFAIAVGVLAFLVSILFMLVLASRVGDKGRPRWPWEKHE